MNNEKNTHYFSILKETISKQNPLKKYFYKDNRYTWNTLCVSTICLYAVSVFTLAWALPATYNLLFDKEVAKTAIFYAPLDKQFVYTEQVRIDDAKAMEKSEDHHADVVYKDENGAYYTREDFESKIPFLYYRNMEMRGLLPVEIDGEKYDRSRIEKHRRVLELNARQLDNKYHIDKIYPLLESNPNQVALTLPADRFRMTKNKMQFVDSDKNAIHEKLTREFTSALRAKGFSFPAQNVWGNFTIFKPYDAGVFILDAKGKTFHILRVKDKPQVTLVPFSNNIIPEKILVSETKDKELLGLMLDVEDNMYIMHTKNYALTQIPAPKYRSKNMDFKVLLDPIYVTALYSDKEKAYALVYPYDFTNKNQLPKALTSVDSYEMLMSRTQKPLYATLAQFFFPFSITLKSENSVKNAFDIQFQSVYTVFSFLFSLLLMFLYKEFCKRKKYHCSYEQAIFILVFGIYAIIPLLLMESYRKR